ncbi:MAG TPA: CoA ester lyase [Solirubrobacteraceae bacterium]|nr:CoA ester lyase [Solirubrobacteraceae bacterium]
MSEQLLRSLLFVPGNDERKLGKAGSTGADLVVIDLEDGVAEAEKTGARSTAADAAGRISAHARVAVRVNGIETGRLEEDVASVTAAPGVSVIVVPKVEAVDTLPVVDDLLAGSALGLLALVETPLGITRCEDILASAPPRTITAMLGIADFTAALGVDLSAEGTELLYARQRLIVAARAAGMPGPIDGPYLRLDDETGLLADTRRSRALGFQGRVALHPRQVDPINRAYSELSDEQLGAAERIVAAFEEAEAAGTASIRVDGRFVDYPVYELARALLRRHAAYQRERPTPPR